jgi:hypothetical protein
MLMEQPEKTIRLYVTSEDHVLWNNTWDVIKNGGMTIGFHAHHCNLTLDVVKGLISNTVISPTEDGDCVLDRYHYSSKIRNGAGGFEKHGVDTFSLVSDDFLHKGDSVTLEASDIHTVWASAGIVNAWFVYEGLEDPGYLPFCWSSANLSDIELSGLYQKMSPNQVVITLKSAGLL